MDGLPARGHAVASLGLVLPPARMPGRRGTRPLKRWRYVGVYTPELMLCVGEAHIGPMPQRWWAVALPDGELRERTTVARGGVELEGPRVRVRAKNVEIDLELEESDGVQIASPAGEHYIWTRKQAAVPVRGRVVIEGATYAIDDDAGFIDDSAGYHPRHTAWRWSAGVGRDAEGRRVAWNLVDGVHDSATGSERTVWVGNEPREVNAQPFAADLSAVGGLRFTEWSAREQNMNLGVLRSHYRQPFGAFAGALPGGIALAEGFGVMEHHDVHW
jgi:hypothetical protein